MDRMSFGTVGSHGRAYVAASQAAGVDLAEDILYYAKYFARQAPVGVLPIGSVTRQFTAAAILHPLEGWNHAA